MFTEQMGLVRVVPIEYVYEIIENVMAPNLEEAEVEETDKVHDETENV